MRLSRPLVALGVSLALHAAAGGAMLGVAVWQGWQFARTVDFELVSTKVTEVKELPLGPPPSPRPSGEPRTGKRRARQRASADDGVKLAAHDAGADAQDDAGAGVGDGGR